MMDLTQLSDGSEDRAQVGIGTLIVFIAMVLVAAIAAGVLVNTAGFLQATAEDTGQESVDQVTERLDVINQHATVNSSGEGVGYLNLTVGLASGAGAVDMDDTTVKYVSNSEVRTLTNSSSATASDSEFKVTAIEATDSDDSYGVLNSNEDRYEVVISAADIEPDDGLTASETVQLEITTQAGGTTEVVLTMPDQLAGSDAGDPVPI